jgi:hypothetical protein
LKIFTNTSVLDIVPKMAGAWSNGVRLEDHKTPNRDETFAFFSMRVAGQSG